MKTPWYYVYPETYNFQGLVTTYKALMQIPIGSSIYVKNTLATILSQPQHAPED